MHERGRVLIADDEETFLTATADLLRDEGYKCDCVTSAPEAAEMIKQNSYDVFIADIKMPGNANLEFIAQLSELAEGLPVILVTGYPSLETAVSSIRHRVAAYMVKPLDFDKLLEHVDSSTKYSLAYHAVTRTGERLKKWCKDLAKVEDVMSHSRSDISGVPIASYVDLTVSNIVGALSDLKHLTKTTSSEQNEQEAYHLFESARSAMLIDVLKDAVSVLEKTKTAFKSKDIGELRRKLQATIRDSTSRQN